MLLEVTQELTALTSADTDGRLQNFTIHLSQKPQPGSCIMCLQTSWVKPWDSWNWSGDEIIHQPIIRASRLIPSEKKRYDIDIREFLTTRDNAVLAQALGELVAGLPVSEQALFRSHAAGSLDFRGG